MKEDKYTKSLAKNHVYAIVLMRDMWKSVLPKFIKLCMEMFVSLSGAQIWLPENNRNICFWVFLLVREFFV